MRKQQRPRFGEKGTTGVKYVGELPFEHRGVCSGENYVWNERRPSVWVDKRDLPALVRVAGRENLEAVGLEEEKPKPRKVKQEKQEEVEL